MKRFYITQHHQNGTVLCEKFIDADDCFINGSVVIFYNIYSNYPKKSNWLNQQTWFRRIFYPNTIEDVAMYPTQLIVVRKIANHSDLSDSQKSVT